MLEFNFLHCKDEAQRVQWHAATVPATGETEMGGNLSLGVPDQYGQQHSETLSQNKT